MASVNQAQEHALRTLHHALLDMGDALQAVGPDALHARGGWDRALFADVLAYIEQRTPDFQDALVMILAAEGAYPPDWVRALLAVDRLSAAYTYWTRLFPPRQADEAMFVLSLLHDLSEKVEYAIALVEQGDVG